MKKSFCCWSIAWAETCKPGVWRAGFRAPCVGADVWATPYSCPEHHPLGHYAWEPLPHRHWQAKDWWFWLLLKRGWTATPSRKCTLPLQRWSRRGSNLKAPSVPAVCHCHWPWRTCAPSLLHVKELRWRSDVLPLCSIGALAARASVAHQAAASQLKRRHCWRLLRRKRLARLIRVCAPHSFTTWQCKPTAWSLEQDFLYLRPLCFHWLRMIASTPLAQFHIHVDSLIGMTKPFLIEPRRNVPPWRSPCLLRDESPLQASRQIAVEVVWVA